MKQHSKGPRNGYGNPDHAGPIVAEIVKEEFGGEVKFGAFRRWANSIYDFEDKYQLDIGTISLWATPLGSSNDEDRSRTRSQLEQHGLQVELAERKHGKTAKDSVFRCM